MFCYETISQEFFLYSLFFNLQKLEPIPHVALFFEPTLAAVRGAECQRELHNGDRKIENERSNLIAEKKKTRKISSTYL